MCVWAFLFPWAVLTQDLWLGAPREVYSSQPHRGITLGQEELRADQAGIAPTEDRAGIHM